MKLTATNIEKSYKGRKVVKGISVEVSQGEIVGLLGPNGAGKTTSFYMIVGLIKPNNGAIFLDDKEITKSPMYQRAQNGIGYLAQEASVFRKLSVEDNILSVLQLTSLRKKQQKEKMESLLEEFGLTHIRKNRGDLLSGGERRRTEIARALATRPRLLICDEPTSALDVSIQAQVLNLLKDIQDELHLTMLFISHDLPVIRQMCNRIVVLKNGSICETKESEELFNNPEHQYTKELIRLMPKIESII